MLLSFVSRVSFVALMITEILLVGLGVDSSPCGQTAIGYFESTIEQVPGGRSVYESVRRMSEMILEADAQNVPEVARPDNPSIPVGLSGPDVSRDLTDRASTRTDSEPTRTDSEPIRTDSGPIRTDNDSPAHEEGDEQ